MGFDDPSCEGCLLHVWFGSILGRSARAPIKAGFAPRARQSPLWRRPRGRGHGYRPKL